MRILFVTPEPPFPPQSGGRILTYHAVRWLAEQGHEVSVLSLTHEPGEPVVGPLRKWCRHVDLFPARPRWHLPSMVQAMIDPRLPYKAIRFAQPDWRRRFVERTRSGEFDLVHLQTFYPGEVIGRRSPLPVLHYAENAEGLLLAQLARRATNPALRAVAALEARRTLRYERVLIARCTRTLAISETDRQRLVEAGCAPVHGVLPPYLDTEHTVPAPLGRDDPRFDLVFMGQMKYYPNADGAVWLVRRVMPCVWSERPQTTLAIVGQGPPPVVRALAGDRRVTVTGWVPETAPFVRGARVCTVPLRMGSGVRLKILEAGAQGKAIVSTPLGAEGLVLQNERDLLLAEDAHAFAEALCSLLDDEARRDTLGNQARETIVTHYDYRRVLPTLEQHYRAMLHLH